MIVHDVAGFLRRLPRELSAGGVRCVGATFGLDGRFRFRFVAHRSRVVMSWGRVGRGSAAIDGLPGVFRTRGARAIRVRRAISETLRDRLAAVWADYRPAPFDHFHDDESEVAFERASVQRLFDPFLRPGETRCDAVRFESFGFDDEWATLSFADRDGTVEHDLLPTGSDRPRAAGPLVASNRAFSLRKLADRRAVDLVVGSSHRRGMTAARGVPFLELGVPSYQHHAFVASPYYGFRGAACLAQRIVNVLNDAG